MKSGAIVASGRRRGVDFRQADSKREKGWALPPSGVKPEFAVKRRKYWFY